MNLNHYGTEILERIIVLHIGINRNCSTFFFRMAVFVKNDKTKLNNVYAILTLEDKM